MTRKALNQTLLSRYELGKSYIDKRSEALATSKSEAEFWRSLAKGTLARELMNQHSQSLGISFKTLRSAVEFAEAVESLLANCGNGAMETIFHGKYLQTEEAIKKLSRTSDVRQQYRMLGVSEGRFRSLAPQPTDLVFDTVSFQEVNSRLARARGAIVTMDTESRSGKPPSTLSIAIPILEDTKKAAFLLAKFLDLTSVSDSDIPEKLTKKSIWEKFKSGERAGTFVGKARLALRLTIKSAWDYPEMCRRQLRPSKEDAECTRREVKTISKSIASLKRTWQFAQNSKR
ncbi:hypothetical protein C5Y96_03020 [Blastopirellula marina]|uniref:Uncharacterized protein n=1 Tax=Blastopirellula marina TaxID=124 RepID=A0A2S8G338_9BACT|nr:MULTISPECIES: hypothetical protein [Pirellulaceae]PQO38858.1 hypothetical protein C5Y96_03020 [Blastopirellula marina]RCS55166.1 hypothetical protein DTL36_03025 [Bremerella cremea]